MFQRAYRNCWGEAGTKKDLNRCFVPDQKNVRKSIRTFRTQDHVDFIFKGFRSILNSLTRRETHRPRFFCALGLIKQSNTHTVPHTHFKILTSFWWIFLADVTVDLWGSLLLYFLTNKATFVRISHKSKRWLYTFAISVEYLLFLVTFEVNKDWVMVCGVQGYLFTVARFMNFRVQ